MSEAIPNQTILVIDDSPSMRELLSLVLADQANVVSVGDGEAGLATARDIKPGLIILDIGMPGMDGYEVCRTLKSSEDIADIPVIFITAHENV